MGLFFYGLFENFAAFFGEAVFLEAAVGFAGDGVFDEGFRKELTNTLVQLARDGFVSDTRGDHGFRNRPFAQRGQNLFTD